MNALILSLALTAPSQPPVFPQPIQLAPGVRLQPQIAPQQYGGYRQPVYVPLPPNPQPVAPRALTLAEFSRFFTPIPGKHDVWIVHPSTGRPVQVCFTLPGGLMRDYEVDKRSIRFEFECGTEVDIDFRNNGTVRVEYDD